MRNSIVVKLSKSNGAPAKDLIFVGANFRTAAATERQHLTLSREQFVGLQAAVSARFPGAEFCMLSTCNRTEFYLAAEQSDDVLPALISVLCGQCPHLESLLAAGKIHFQRGLAAYQHLLRVSCGLESSVLGDTQIVQQVRHSLQMAREAGCTGTYLEQAFGRALSLASRVRSETDISVGSPGVAAAACEAIRAWQRRSAQKTASVLLVGAGTINSGVARLLAKEPAYGLFVINRSADKAHHLANQFSGRAIPWSQLPTAVARASAIVVATSSSTPVVTTSMLDAAAPLGGCDRKLVIDAGMPPNVERCSLPGVTLVGIDELAERQDEQLSRRRAAIADVEAAIEQELATFDRWLAQRPLESVLKSLYLDLDALPQRISRQLAFDNSPSRSEIQTIIHRHLKQLLHPHVTDLRRMVRAETSRSGAVKSSKESHA